MDTSTSIVKSRAVTALDYVRSEKEIAQSDLNSSDWREIIEDLFRGLRPRIKYLNDHTTFARLFNRTSYVQSSYGFRKTHLSLSSGHVIDLLIKFGDLNKRIYAICQMPVHPSIQTREVAETTSWLITTEDSKLYWTSAVYHAEVGKSCRFEFPEVNFEELPLCAPSAVPFLCVGANIVLRLTEIARSVVIERDEKTQGFRDISSCGLAYMSRISGLNGLLQPSHAS